LHIRFRFEQGITVFLCIGFPLRLRFNKQDLRKLFIIWL